MAFEMKQWLDEHVVPLTHGEVPLRIYSFIWNGNPPKEVLVWLLAGAHDQDETFDPSAWPRAVKILLDEHEFRFDYLREQQVVTLDSGMVPIFGGDGAPLYNQAGMASCRLFKQVDDRGLILQVGCAYPASPRLSAGEHAAAATKAFYGQFEDENPLTVCQRYGAVFGQA